MWGLVDRFCAQTGVPPDAAADIRLAIEEAYSNIVQHGYHARGGHLELDLKNDGGLLTITFVDKAPLFDPTALPASDPSVPFERPPGKRGGWRWVRRVMDEVRHRPGFRKKGNVITLIKKVELQAPRPHLRLER